METLFSFASWNVENFHGEPGRIRRTIKFLKKSNPDVFAIYEVKGKDVFNSLTTLMPTHQYFLTEGEEWSEILVGVNRDFSCFVTQRHSLKSDVQTLRPGALATLTIDGDHYSLLFLHLKSSDKPRSWGLRDDMIYRVRDLKKAIDEADESSNETNFIALGDINTMGMNLTYSEKDLNATEEIDRYEEILDTQNIERLSKSANNTWWNGTDSQYDPSNLDHVFSSKHLNFREFGDGKKIDVRGWPKLEGEKAQTEWIENYSDHAMLYGEILQNSNTS